MYSQLIYSGSDHMAMASNALQKVVQILLRKEMSIVQYLNYINYVSFSSWDQGQIGIKFETEYII